jgi:hypothetical protein
MELMNPAIVPADTRLANSADSPMSDLIFVYALDGGLFNDIAAYAHKVLSPGTYPCNLCALTHGPLGTRREWAQFVKGLGVRTEFIHQDAFARRYPAAKLSFPAVLRSNGNGGAPQVLISSEELNACRDLPSFISLVRERTNREITTR